MPDNYAAYLTGPAKPFSVLPAPYPTCASHEVLIKVYAVAINPVDAARAAYGMYIPSYPYIVGCDAAGVILEVGSSVHHLSPGDRVLTATSEYDTLKSSAASFQLYLSTDANRVARFPKSISYTSATVVPLGLSTAAGMLFEKASLNLSWPSLDHPQTKNQILIIYGASSSVGVNAVQLSRMAGYRVIAICGTSNASMVREAGAEIVFARDSTLAEKIAEYVKEQIVDIVGIANAVSLMEGAMDACVEILKGLESIDKAEDGKQIQVRKAIGTVHPRGIEAMPVPKVDGVEVFGCLSIDQDDLREYIWGAEGLLVKKLGVEHGLKCLPEPQIVGRGLEMVNEACRLMGEGVSGKKLVVEIVKDE